MQLGYVIDSTALFPTSLHALDLKISMGIHVYKHIQIVQSHLVLDTGLMNAMHPQQGNRYIPMCINNAII